MQAEDTLLRPGTANKTVHTFAHLNRSKRFRAKQGLFAMEGSRLIFDAVKSGVKLLSADDSSCA